MIFRTLALGCFLTAASCAVSVLHAADEKPAEGADAEKAEASEAPEVNQELENEIAYVEALVNYGYPDYAGPVIEATKKKWPESEARFFAIEIRGLLSLGKFDEAEKKIAALPDRKGAKYWAARLEVANNYFARSQKEACMKIYDEFFTLYANPPKELVKFHMEASYMYGQLLFNDKKFDKAAKIYSNLLKRVKGEDWCNLATETVKVYLRAADELSDPKRKNEREVNLKAAEKIVDKLLWQLDQPVYFGQAVSMKAHIQAMRGKVERANEILEEYLPNLQEIHDQIVAADPEGKLGLMKLSPLPECLYLQSKMLWDEAKAEYKKSPRDDNRVKDLMFGAKDKQSGRRDGKGAFNLAVKIFLNYEQSPWAAPAGEMSEEIKESAAKWYKANVKTTITAEQIAKVRAAQFKSADENFNAGQYPEAIEAYFQALSKYPELEVSVRAIANVVSAMLDMYAEEKDEAKKEDLRTDLDAIEGYLAERFAGNRDKIVMSTAGNAVIGIAAKEQERGQIARADRLYTEFIVNYRNHANAAPLAAGKAGEAQKAEKYDDAIKYWGLIERFYTNTTFYAGALAQLSYCHGKLGHKKEEIEYINRYLPIETVKIRRLQAQMQLATMYQKDGLALLASAGETNDVEAVEAIEKKGTAQIVRAIKQFLGFSKQAADAIADPSTPKGDIEKYVTLREVALFLVGECWGRMMRPEKNLKMYRERAAESYENYVKAYPEGKYVKAGLVKLGTIYTALGDLAKSKDALDRLSQKYPDSDEAKNAKPRLAKNLIEMGMKREGTQIYGEMLRTEDGKYTAGQFLNAGEALIEAKSWELANQAFDKAIHLAATNQQTTVARARLGLAKSAFKQGSFAEARETLELFLQDPKMSKMAIAADANFMMVEIASAQGRNEKDADMRGKYFGAAIGALKKVRTYWAKKPQWEQDQLDLLSGDVLVSRMKAEDAMGLKEAAQETCGRAASTFVAFIQSHGVDEQHPADKMSAGELANLEQAYARMLPLFVRLGSDQADRVMKYGQQYLDLFPNGKNRTEVLNCMNQAKADLPAAGAAAAEEKPAEKPAVEEKPAAGEKPAETETKTASEGE